MILITSIQLTLSNYFPDNPIMCDVRLNELCRLI